MIALPLIRTESVELTPMDKSAEACANVVTAMMTAATLTDPTLTEVEREGYTLLITAVIVPAEA
jgi:hypothetical protein